MLYNHYQSAAASSNDYTQHTAAKYQFLFKNSIRHFWRKKVEITDFWTTFWKKNLNFGAKIQICLDVRRISGPGRRHRDRWSSRLTHFSVVIPLCVSAVHLPLKKAQKCEKQAQKYFWELFREKWKSSLENCFFLFSRYYKLYNADHRVGWI